MTARPLVLAINVLFCLLAMSYGLRNESSMNENNCFYLSIEINQSKFKTCAA